MTAGVEVTKLAQPSGTKMPKADPLIPVQAIDADIHKLRVQRDARPRELAAGEEKLARARASLEAVRAEIKALRLESAKRETTVKELDDKINKLLTQMNMAKKNDEYQAFQKEISGHKADKSRVEEGLLDLMYQVEEKAKLEKVREGEVKAAESSHAAESARIKSEMEALDKDIQALEARRREAVHGLDGELLSLYERILEAKEDGVALAPLVRYETVEDKGVVHYWGCGGCSMGVTSQDANELKRGKEIVRCRSCSRILYWPEGMDVGRKA